MSASAVNQLGSIPLRPTDRRVFLLTVRNEVPSDLAGPMFQCLSRRSSSGLKPVKHRLTDNSNLPEAVRDRTRSTVTPAVARRSTAQRGYTGVGRGPPCAAWDFSAIKNDDRVTLEHPGNTGGVPVDL